MAILTPILFLIVLIALGYLAIRTNRSLLRLALQLQADRQAVDADRKAVEADRQSLAVLKINMDVASKLIEDHTHSIVSLESAVAELNIESINAKTARPHDMGTLRVQDLFFEDVFTPTPAVPAEPEKPKKKRAKKSK